MSVKLNIRHWDSVGHIVEDSARNAKRHDPNLIHRLSHRPGAEHHDPNWHGTDTWSDLKSLVEGGYKDSDLDQDLADLGLGSITEKIRGEGVIDGFAFHHDTIGFMVDVEAFVNGSATPMIAAVPEPRMGSVGRSVRVLVNLTASYDVSPADMKKRGLVLLALVDVLATSGYGVDLWGAVSTKTSRGGHQQRVELVQLKAPSEQYDVGRIGFGLVNPSLLRRVMFDLWETRTKSEQRDYGSNYGSVSSIPKRVIEDMKPDVLFERPMSSYEAGAMSNPIKWVTDKLVELGIINDEG